MKRKNKNCLSHDRADRAILWAPWRIHYIKNTRREKGCIFCTKPSESDDQGNLILYRGRHAFIIMNRYPYNNGHLMVVPFQHTASLEDLPDPVRLELMALLDLSQKALGEVMHPQGFNIGMNIGRLAGAGIEEHLHFHVVPRWGGDTNFMPVIGHTKVISEALEETWEQLRSVMKHGPAAPKGGEI